MSTLALALCAALSVSSSHGVLAARAFDAKHLFPIPIVNGYTSAPDFMDVGRDVVRIPLSDNGLRIVTPRLWGDPKVEPAPDGIRAYKAVYPKDSYSTAPQPPGIGGFGFKFTGPLDFLEGDEILFSYAVYFAEDFEFALGGKLPGPYGGANEATASGCAGGRQTDRDKCFSLRLMWREFGDGEIYAYVPPSSTDALMKLKGSKPDPRIYGFSIARGAFKFARGEWTVVAQRVKLNTFGQANGEIELWVNGKSVIHATGVVLRAVETTKIRGIEADTFFGGSNHSWASPKDQVSYMAAFSAAIVAPGSSPADGKALYPLASAAQRIGRTGSAVVGHIALPCFIAAAMSASIFI